MDSLVSVLALVLTLVASFFSMESYYAWAEESGLPTVHLVRSGLERESQLRWLTWCSEAWSSSVGSGQGHLVEPGMLGNRWRTRRKGLTLGRLTVAHLKHGTRSTGALTIPSVLVIALGFQALCGR